ncbi:colicin-like pore-forming protein [Pantoea sp. C8B4]|uniref:colicin-like pore-forming protein n=1 Tax=Pantoea sp. C8B4 TaxID=3243083 RepID=UPI003ED9870A
MPGFNYGGASDQSGWSSENNPWGSGLSGSPSQNHNDSKSPGLNGGIAARIDVSVAKPGEYYLTPWGKVIISPQGQPMMNGIIMTVSNSSMVDNPWGGITRVLNSELGKKPIPKGNSINKSPTQINVENYLAGGSWSGPGPIDTTLVNTAISALTSNYIVNKNTAFSRTTVYQKLIMKINELQLTEQEAAKNQINQAYQNAYSQMPDKIWKSFYSGGSNGHDYKKQIGNSAKVTMAELIPAVSNDINKNLNRNKESSTQELLDKTSDMIITLGDKISASLSINYKNLSNDISSNIRNFRGKSIRNINDAMSSLNKIFTNPDLKVNQSDKEAINNALKAVNAQTISNNLSNLSKGFQVLDFVQKIKNVIVKVNTGLETGNWYPLMLEVESWVISGVAASIALGIFSATLAQLGLIVGIPITAIALFGILIAAFISSLIDDALIQKLNNEIIKSAH